MASGDVNITVVGNVVADPELRFTSTGAAVATFRVASTPRRYDSQSGQWVDGEALFLTCNVWRQVAENIAETLTKGMRVIVTGRLRSRSYDTQNGDRRTVMELEVDEVGPSLRYATAQVTRNPRGEGGGNYGGGFGGQPSSSLHRNNNSSRCSRNIRSHSNSNRSSNHNNGRRNNNSNHPPMILGHPHHQPMVVSGALMMSLRSKTQ